MVSPSSALQGGFILASVSGLTVYCFPSLRSQFISYGSRRNDQALQKGSSTTASVTPNASNNSSSSSSSSSILQVPHSWFLHFYIVSVLSSIFWLVQILLRGTVVQQVCLANETRGSDVSMTFDQILLTWSLMLVQGTRRLVETASQPKSSSSTMWVVHWLMGIAFYLAMSVAVWIDGSPELLAVDRPLSSFRIAYPSLKTLLGLPLFLVASGIQHDCHSYLASLKKYTLPEHPLFNTVVCPHYLAECVIYLSLAIISAPPGLWMNRTVTAALVFVVANLSVTASDTKTWYGNKFGKDKVAHRWVMLPGVW